MNWLISHMIKEARGRRFNPQDKVRYFTEGRKGKGRNIVLTPSFSRGTVVDFDTEKRRYRVKNNKDEVMDVHPRNIMPDSITPVNIQKDIMQESIVPEPAPMSMPDSMTPELSLS